METVDEIRSRGGRALPIACDVGIEAQLEAMVETVHAEFGPVDLLINNAALTAPGRPPSGESRPHLDRRATSKEDRSRPLIAPTFLGTPIKSMRLHFEVNLFAACRTMQLVLPDMIAAGHGGVINIGSQAAHRPGPGPYPADRFVGFTVPGYGASKAALEQVTTTVAAEMAPHGIAVNILIPAAPVATPGMRYYVAEMPMSEPDDDMAEAAVRLALADPAQLTGQIVYDQDLLHPERGVRGYLGPK
jgi:NAD(P)-dependent dehydrogenase (short-subunit alcohol dehydrogenase family)